MEYQKIIMLQWSKEIQLRQNTINTAKKPVIMRILLFHETNKTLVLCFNGGQHNQN